VKGSRDERLDVLSDRETDVPGLQRHRQNRAVHGDSGLRGVKTENGRVRRELLDLLLLSRFGIDWRIERRTIELATREPSIISLIGLSRGLQTSYVEYYQTHCSTTLLESSCTASFSSWQSSVSNSIGSIISRFVRLRQIRLCMRRLILHCLRPRSRTSTTRSDSPPSSTAQG